MLKKIPIFLIVLLIVSFIYHYFFNCRSPELPCGIAPCPNECDYRRETLNSYYETTSILFFALTVHIVGAYFWRIRERLK